MAGPEHFGSFLLPALEEILAVLPATGERVWTFLLAAGKRVAADLFAAEQQVKPVLLAAFQQVEWMPLRDVLLYVSGGMPSSCHWRSSNTGTATCPCSDQPPS